MHRQKVAAWFELSQMLVLPHFGHDGTPLAGVRLI
jgi:hypothetical protein